MDLEASQVALRTHMQPASRSQETTFETKIFNFRCFFGPSYQNQLFHTPLLSKIWGQGDRIFFGNIPLNPIFIFLDLLDL